MKKLIESLVAVALVLSFIGNALGVVQYTVTDLNTLGGTRSLAFDINNSGQVVGYADTNSGDSHAFLYSSGIMKDLGTLGGATSEAYGINNNGQVVGYAKTNNNYNHAFLYSGTGPMQDIGPVGVKYSYAYDINDNGLVVEYAIPSSSSIYFHALLYSGNGPTQDLGTLPGGELSDASGINNSGQVVGGSNYLNRGEDHAFLYSGGTMRDLGTFGGLTSEAYGINNNGQVVGCAYLANDNTYHAFLYNGVTKNDLGTLGGTNSNALDINDSGQVVGTSDGSAFLWQSDGGMQNLNNLKAAGSDLMLVQATAINDNGQIVGYGTNTSGQIHAFLLTPIPEPSTLALLSMGAISLLAYTWRRRKSGT